MLMRPSNRVLEAFSMLERDERFVEIKAWLEHSLAETYARMTSIDAAAELRQQQGSAKTLKEIIDTAANARSMLEKVVQIHLPALLNQPPIEAVFYVLTKLNG